MPYFSKHLLCAISAIIKINKNVWRLIFLLQEINIEQGLHNTDKSPLNCHESISIFQAAITHKVVEAKHHKLIQTPFTPQTHTTPFTLVALSTSDGKRSMFISMMKRKLGGHFSPEGVLLLLYQNLKCWLTSKPAFFPWIHVPAWKPAFFPWAISYFLEFM